MVIYGDILLALNGWIDFLLLLGVRRITGGKAPPWRLAAGSFAGALAGFLVFLPPLPVWLTLLIKLLAAAGMVRLAFCWRDVRFYVKQTGVLFGLSAGLAGLCGALYFFAAPTDFFVVNGVVYYAVPPLLLVGLTVVCYGVLWGMERISRHRAPAGLTFPVDIAYGDKSVRVRCLYDSGNHLTEPFSGWPVLVLERREAEELLPVPDSAEQIPLHSAAGWRLIPYDSLGGSGLLPAFKPDSVCVTTRQGQRKVADCYVAVCSRLGRGEYHGLMGSAMGDGLV